MVCKQIVDDLRWFTVLCITYMAGVDTVEVPSEAPATLGRPEEVSGSSKRRTIYELCITNAGKWLKVKDIKKVLEAHGIDTALRIKKDASAMVGFVHFTEQEALNIAKEKLNGMKVKAMTWMVRENPSFEEFTGATAPSTTAVAGQKRPRSEISSSLTPEEIEAKLADAVIPWHRVPYEEQLQRKHEEMKGVMRTLVSKLRAHILRNVDMPRGLYKKICNPDTRKVNATADSTSVDPPSVASAAATYADAMTPDELKEASGDRLPEWLRTVPCTLGFQACSVEPVIPSPVLEAYRNKVELNFGRTPAGDITLGNRFSGFAESVEVWPIYNMPHVGDNMKSIAKAIVEFVKSSAFSIYDVVSHIGTWRMVTMRSTTHEAQVMIMLMYNPPTTEDDRTVLSAELERFAACCLASGANIRSIHVQEFSGLSSPPPNHPYKLIHGSSTIEEHLCGKKFLISPGAFFQVNTHAGELLFNIVRQYAQRYRPGGAAKKDNVALLDVCCGTGTIALICASDFTKVVGVELSASAVEDAKANSAFNDITNATFIAAKAEDVMKDMLHIVGSAAGGSGMVDEVIAVVDPPRGGLHPDVIRALRTCRLIHTLVYVSCNPTGSFIEDSVKLCSPPEKSSRVLSGPPFAPVVSTPVDMFPHTPHCELVTLFHRDN